MLSQKKIWEGGVEKGRGEGSKQKGEKREREDNGDKIAVLTVLSLFICLGTSNNSSPSHRGSHRVDGGGSSSTERSPNGRRSKRWKKTRDQTTHRP